MWSCYRTSTSTTRVAPSPLAAGAQPELVFPNATYVVGAEAWQRAVQPHARDRASFIPGLTELLADTGRLELRPPARAPRRSATATGSIAARATRPACCSPRSRCPTGRSCSRPT